MQPEYCPKCGVKPANRSIFVRYGFYYRSSDKKYVRRYRCNLCRATFGQANFQPFKHSKVRHLHEDVVKWICSGASQRRIAFNLGVRKNTIVRIFLLEAARAELELGDGNLAAGPCKILQFDDMETFEHTKCKPLSISLAVEERTRRIIGVDVSQMAARGPLVGKAKAKYGQRIDKRRAGRQRLFMCIEERVAPDMLVKSDQNPHYSADIKRHFPLATHKTYKGKRGAITGQGELKKVKFDPLFSLNHTAAKLRADINRLFRRTWCTTKKADHLYRHLVLYALFHNSKLISGPLPV
jgi:transposase-like protein